MVCSNTKRSDIMLCWLCRCVFTTRCYAERGTATAKSSVHLSVRDV